MSYCTECGTKNDDDSRYCDSCGAALSQIKAQGKIIAKGDDSISLFERLTFGKKISFSGAGLAIICFFLPWIKACGGSLSGFDIATKGPDLGASGSVFLFLIPICSIIIIWQVINSAKEMVDINDNGLIIGVSVIPLIILIIFYFKIQNALGGAPFEVFTFWFLLTILSFIASAGGAFMETQADTVRSP